MKGFAAAVDRWWFEPTERYQLGLFRIILFYFLTLRYLKSTNVAAWLRPRVPPELMVSNLAWDLVPLPVPAPDFLGFPLSAWVELLYWGCLLGVFTRFSLAGLATIFTYLYGMRNSYGWFNHEVALVVDVLWILPFAPGISSWSVDSVAKWAWRKLMARRKGEGDAPGLLQSLRGPAVAPWAGRLILLLFCVVYLGAGVAKLRHGGLAWLDGKTLTYYLKGHSTWGGQLFVGAEDPPPETLWKDGVGLAAQLYGNPRTKLGKWLTKRPWTIKLMSWITVAWELAFPVVLLGGWCLALMLIVGAVTHVGILLSMKITFIGYIWLYTSQVDWIALVRFFRRRLARGEPADPSP